MNSVLIVTENNLVQAVVMRVPLSAETMRVVRCIWPEMPERPLLATIWQVWKVFAAEWYAAEPYGLVAPEGVDLVIGFSAVPSPPPRTPSTYNPAYGSRGRLVEKVLLVVDLVGREYGYSRAEMLGRARHQPLAEARQVAAYLSQLATGISWTLLGIAFNRDHGTMLHAKNRVREMISVDRSFGDRMLRLASEAMRATT